MKAGKSIVFGPKYTTIEESILSFLFKDILIFGFPKSPKFFYILKPFLLLFTALLICFGYLDSYMKEISVLCLIVSGLSIMYARKKQEKYELQQIELAEYRKNKLSNL
jgi:hypothetical protein